MINHRKRLDYQQIHTICLYSRRVFLYTFYTEIDIFQSHQDRGNKNADTTTKSHMLSQMHLLVLQATQNLAWAKISVMARVSPCGVMEVSANHRKRYFFIKSLSIRHPDDHRLQPMLGPAAPSYIFQVLSRWVNKASRSSTPRTKTWMC